MRTIADYKWFGEALRALWIKDIEIDPQSDDLINIFKQHKKLVIATNHGPTLGPIAGLAGYSTYYNQIGAGQRVPFAVTWKQFYDIPVLRQLARYVTQIKQVESPAGFAKRLQNGPYNDFWVAPEGDNCNFGNGRDIQPFLSPGFIEIAIRAEVPVLIAVHQGSEYWSHNLAINDRTQQLLGKLPLPQRYLERLADTGTLSISNIFKGRLSPCRLSFHLYQPQLTAEQLSEDRAERKQQLWVEANNVRDIMQTTIDRLGQEDNLGIAA